VVAKHNSVAGRRRLKEAWTIGLNKIACPSLKQILRGKMGSLPLESNPQVTESDA
jgi:hypothetical protein